MTRSPARLAPLLALAAALVAGCSGDRPTAYETCEVGGRSCQGVDGCSMIRVEYAEGAATGAFCTSLCSTDADCPRDVRGAAGACLEFPGVTECFERCATSDDCPEGFGCVDRLVDSEGMIAPLPAAVCLPVLSR